MQARLGVRVSGLQKGRPGGSYYGCARARARRGNPCGPGPAGGRCGADLAWPAERVTLSSVCVP
jgi:hypothetical protein